MNLAGAWNLKLRRHRRIGVVHRIVIRTCAAVGPPSYPCSQPAWVSSYIPLRPAASAALRIDRIDIDVLAVPRRRERHRVSAAIRVRRTGVGLLPNARSAVRIDRDRCAPIHRDHDIAAISICLEGQNEFGRRLEHETRRGTSCIGVMHRVVIRTRAAVRRPAASVRPVGMRIIIFPGTWRAHDLDRIHVDVFAIPRRADRYRMAPASEYIGLV